MGIAYLSPTDALRLDFLKELQEDLKRIGNEITISEKEKFIKFNFTPDHFLLTRRS